MAEVMLCVIGLLVLWFVLGFGIARENEQLVKILLGRPYGIADSGIYWIPFLAAWVRTYPTKVVELQIAQRDADGKIARNAENRPIPAGGFITTGGEITMNGVKRVIGPINMGVTLSFRFTWPQTKTELIKCVRLLPDPQDEAALVNIFQEIVMDETRSVGCKMSYIEIMSDRAAFAKAIKESVLLGEASRLLTETGLQNSAQIVIDHIDIPKTTLEAIDDEESKRLQAEGVRREAEGRRDQLKLEAEGRAAGYAALKAGGKEAMQFEELRTLREMATGTSNTIFFPLEGIKNLFSNFMKTR